MEAEESHWDFKDNSAKEQYSGRRRKYEKRVVTLFSVIL